MFFKSQNVSTERTAETKTTNQSSTDAVETNKVSISDEVLVRKSRPNILKSRDARATRRATHF